MLWSLQFWSFKKWSIKNVLNVDQIKSCFEVQSCFHCSGLGKRVGVARKGAIFYFPHHPLRADWGFPRFQKFASQEGGILDWKRRQGRQMLLLIIICHCYLCCSQQGIVHGHLLDSGWQELQEMHALGEPFQTDAQKNCCFCSIPVPRARKALESPCPPRAGKSFYASSARTTFRFILGRVNNSLFYFGWIFLIYMDS